MKPSNIRISEFFQIMEMKKRLDEKERSLIQKFGKRILVDEWVKKKIDAVCRAVKKVFKENYEWIGYLLGDENYVVRDFYLPYQVISLATVNEDPEYAGTNLIEMEDLINKTGLKLIGWIHSHGNMSPFHSGTDDQNTFALVRFIGMHAKREVLKLDSPPKRISKVTCQKGNIILEGERSVIIAKLDVPPDLIRLLINRPFLKGDDEKEIIARILTVLLNYAEWWFLRKKWLAPVYSIVTNARLEFYGEIWKFDSEKDPERIASGDIIEFIDISSAEERDIDMDEIIQEVENKMRISRF